MTDKPCSYCGGGANGHRSYCIYHDEQTCPTCRMLTDAQQPIDRMVFANNRGRIAYTGRVITRPRRGYAPKGEEFQT